MLQLWFAITFFADSGKGSRKWRISFFVHSISFVSTRSWKRKVRTCDENVCCMPGKTDNYWFWYFKSFLLEQYKTLLELLTLVKLFKNDLKRCYFYWRLIFILFFFFGGGGGEVYKFTLKSFWQIVTPLSVHLGEPCQCLKTM